MALLKKLSMAAVSSAAAFLALGSLSTESAEAALYSYSFQGDGISGYYIYDTSYTSVDGGGISAYIGAATEYYIYIDGYGTIQGVNGTPTVALSRYEYNSVGVFEDPEANVESDGILLQEHRDDRDPPSEYDLVAYFIYPKGTFNESTEQPTSNYSVTTATARIYPFVDYPNTLGDPVYVGEVTVSIKEVPEPTSIGASLALLGAGAWFQNRRQRQQALSIKN